MARLQAIRRVSSEQARSSWLTRRTQRSPKATPTGGPRPAVGSPPMTPIGAEDGGDAHGPALRGKSNTDRSGESRAPARQQGRRGRRRLAPQLHEVVAARGLGGLLGRLRFRACVATARFLFPNVLFEPPQAFKAGFPGEYNVGEVDTRWKDAFGVWIVRDTDGFYALIAVCTHLGCSPNWLRRGEQVQVPLPRQRLLP